jgi:hypothetical protein
MIELVLESQGKVLGIKVRKILSKQDYTDVLVPHLDYIVQEYGTARLLFSIEGNVQAVVHNSLWEPAGFGHKHKDDIEKLAVVGEALWTEWGQTLAAYLTKSEVKTFSQGEWEKAWLWIIA